jgi:hypothetical protein
MKGNLRPTINFAPKILKPNKSNSVIIEPRLHEQRKLYQSQQDPHPLQHESIGEVE